MIGPSISHSCWDLQFYLYYLILLIQHLLFLSLWTDWGEGEAELSHVTIMCSITYISYQAASGPPVCMQRNEALPVILMSSCCHRRASGLFSNTHSLSLTTNQNPKVVVRKPQAHVILKNRNKKKHFVVVVLAIKSIFLLQNACPKFVLASSEI